MLLARNADGLSGLWFEDQKYHPGRLDLPHRDDDPILAAARAAVLAYFHSNAAGGGAAADGTLPLAPAGTPFQQSVWRALLEIPAGTTLSYGTLALRLGRPEAVRAVAAAVGRNPLSLLIPCHRVVGADGHLTGYAGGLHRKEALLRLEQALPLTGKGPLA
ncbi:methylated-DNA--[protein]-cysteine S-methyltransferase [Roseateles amylovorans]|uniref:Methylated-DNA--[protein]-cysteine S-methyltransferase n=1 Tax=Roseateles amylovorans TaxID=2978473 RepID=A0ABY6B8Z0_9BURK|nr:methylated-DNA--[protein]-cysteine S-methyltransferase [Roseateles amylovorans]UXH80860.1 methylated-DNA--[protein]-cysteine S-methyltransferase [Roseateles amylovorans]